MILTVRNIALFLLAAWLFRSGMTELGLFPEGPTLLGLLGASAGLLLLVSLFVGEDETRAVAATE